MIVEVGSEKNKNFMTEKVGFLMYVLRYSLVHFEPFGTILRNSKKSRF